MRPITLLLALVLCPPLLAAPKNTGPANHRGEYTTLANEAAQLADQAAATEAALDQLIDELADLHAAVTVLGDSFVSAEALPYGPTRADLDAFAAGQGDASALQEELDARLATLEATIAAIAISLSALGEQYCDLVPINAIWFDNCVLSSRNANVAEKVRGLLTRKSGKGSGKGNPKPSELIALGDLLNEAEEQIAAFPARVEEAAHTGQSIATLLAGNAEILVALEAQYTAYSQAIADTGSQLDSLTDDSDNLTLIPGPEGDPGERGDPGPKGPPGQDGRGFTEAEVGNLLESLTTTADAEAAERYTAVEYIDGWTTPLNQEQSRIQQLLDLMKQLETATPAETGE